MLILLFSIKKNPFIHQRHSNTTTSILSTQLTAFKLKILLKDKTFYRCHKKYFPFLMDGKFRLRCFSIRKKNCIPRDKLQRGRKGLI